MIKKILLLILLCSLSVFAIDFKAGDSIKIDSISDDTFVFAGEVEVTGPIEHDLYVFSGRTLVNGAINSNLNIFSGQSLINDDVSGNLNVFSGEVIVDDDVTIYGDAQIRSGKASVNGDFNNLVLSAGEVDFDANVKGTSKINAAELSMNEQRMGAAFGAGLAVGLAAKVLKAIASILFLWVFALILIHFDWSHKIVNHLIKKPLMSIIFGIIFSMLIPLFAVFMAITVIGIPIALFALLAYGIAWLVSGILVIVTIRNYFQWNINEVLALFVYSAIWTLLGIVPFFGLIEYLFTAGVFGSIIGLYLLRK